ncbi:hypothetical protein ACPPVQ_00100 [Diaminobutyricibacter sp. McL0618]|uniref:hypothetical protein n=1 Tax=Leifsonia sp. McL0618 TaxID=3415677 RepID=UPI003CEABB33
MFAALWRVLPGPVWVRILILVVLIAIILFVLVTWVFPWVDSLLGDQKGTVGT